VSLLDGRAIGVSGAINPCIESAVDFDRAEKSFCVALDSIDKGAHRGSRKMHHVQCKDHGAVEVGWCHVFWFATVYRTLALALFLAIPEAGKVANIPDELSSVLFAAASLDILFLLISVFVYGECY